MAEKEYIERGALLEQLNKKKAETGKMRYTEGFNDAIMRVRSMVDSASTADVAPVVHGKWCWEGKFKACSKCGTYVEWTETLGASFWNYCPYCGAKMDGGKQEC